MLIKLSGGEKGLEGLEDGVYRSSAGSADVIRRVVWTCEGFNYLGVDNVEVLPIPRNPFLVRTHVLVRHISATLIADYYYGFRFGSHNYHTDGETAVCVQYTRKFEYVVCPPAPPFVNLQYS